ncbi:MAG TPA: glycosyltransferase family 2 protein [Thermodesulfobacteriota bacterium]|nr:glycosyltransferase family 2 protein [Deltaproteobacteria bacterium]HNR13005.1 glycosyltransferase family 2 protein [Thermodesulfobacteriota bacterium]HNU70504.1 glycosyltransferase family 2 protein [Thermodesulfobacteriota bacterium]HOC38550.1 glycosyltransferase family 2 protein [Thermodesulfobacteriota bacterium]HQO77242.1 glycosyltransferase family 2 protein [Thermodesulfobacteriota bacterium]
MAPRVTIVIVTWNSEQYIARCLAGVKAQRYTDSELIIVDNGSGDNTRALVKEHAPQAQLISNKNNVGFTKASNQGILASRGEFIFSLNPDVFLEPDFLNELVDLLSSSKGYGAVGGKLLLYREGQVPDVIDSTGLFTNRGLRAVDRGNREIDRGQHDTSGPVFALCGAAVLFRREALERIKIADEFFDEEFFAYYDDLDVGWRLQLAGYDIGYTPLARAYHVRGGSGLGDTFFRKIPAMQRITMRNRYLVLIKNLSVVNAVLFAPALLLVEAGIVAYTVFRAPHLWRAYWDVLTRLPAMYRKRRIIQSERVRDSRYIRRWISTTRYG